MRILEAGCRAGSVVSGTLWQYAGLLADEYAVEVLTTTASDYVSWANDLSEGVEQRDGVTIRRFRVARERGRYFHHPHRPLLAHAPSKEPCEAPRVRLPDALAMIQKAVDSEPNNGAYLDSLGWVYFRMGRMQEAEDNMRLAEDLVPHDPTMHDHSAEVLFQASKVREASAPG